jgi:hypothetical protein
MYLLTYVCLLSRFKKIEYIYLLKYSFIINNITKKLRMSVSAGVASCGTGESVVADTCTGTGAGATLLTVCLESVFGNPANYGKMYAIVSDGHVQLLTLIATEYFGRVKGLDPKSIYEFLFKDSITGKLARHSLTTGYNNMGGSLYNCTVYEVENKTTFRFDEFSARFLATHRAK